MKFITILISVVMFSLVVGTILIFFISEIIEWFNRGTR